MTFSAGQTHSSAAFSAQQFQEAQALSKWDSAYVRPWQHKLKELLGQEKTLLRLTPDGDMQQPANGRDRGLRIVPIRRIQGSLGRSQEFTDDFRPLQTHTRERWLNVARAWLAGKPLPPVELLQIDCIYYVIDGHHRISVAHALGQNQIDAAVIAWSRKEAGDNQGGEQDACE